MSDFKLDLRVQMPTREEGPVEEECAHCGQMHSPKEECEGLGGYDHWQPVGYEVPQVEESSYLKKALAQFKKKRAKKKAKGEIK